MVRFRYGNVFMEIEKASEKARSILRRALTVRDEKSGVPYCLVDDHRFLTGLAERAYAALSEAGIAYRVVDQPEFGDITQLSVPDDLLEDVVLYPEYQVQAVIKSLHWKRGVAILPTGSGKTEIAAAIAKLLQEREGLSTMMIVPGINSMHQTWRRWTRRGLEGVGRLGGGIVELDGAEHVITVLDSLRQRIEGGDRQLRKFLRGCGCVIFMEAQHLPADTWMDVGAKLDMPYRIGLSATPYLDEDGPHAVRDLQLIGSTAETVIEIPDSLVMNLGRMSTPVVHFVETTGDWMGGEKNWHRLRRDGIVDNRQRNQAAVRCASRLAKRGRKVIMLATEIPHGRKLATEISKKGVENVFMFQGQSKFTTFRRGTTYRTERKPIYDVADALEELDDYVLVGSPAVDEDADFPDADVLINCSGGRAMGRLVQRVGRVLRAKPEKGNVAHVIDFDDKCAFVLRAHSRRRREIYEARYDGADKFRIFDHEIPDGAVDAVLA